jgi:hypothetical protein
MSFDPAPVTVYSFLTLDQGVEVPSVAPFKATREAIVSSFSGQVLEGTAETVDPELLDALGRVQRVASGWGGLPAG